MRESSARGEKPPGVQRVDFEWHMPRRRNFLSQRDYRFARGTWTLIILGALSFTFYEVYLVSSRWEVLNYSLSEMKTADYTGPRLPFLDVCEDRSLSSRSQHSESVDSAEPPFVVDAQNARSGTPELHANCRYFLNGFASSSLADAKKYANKTYYEISTRKLDKPRVLRDGTAMHGSANIRQYHCYRFAPPPLYEPLQPDDRVLIKWEVEIEGIVPETRVFKRGDVPDIRGLLYRVSLADKEHTSSTGPQYEVMKAAMHKLGNSRKVLVSGRVHKFKWVNSFGYVTKDINTFELTSFDAASGKTDETIEWQEGKPIKSTLTFRIDYTSNVIAVTEWRSDNIVHVMIAISMCISVFSLLKFVGIPFVSVKEMEPDVLTMSWPLPGHRSEGKEEEEAPLLDEQ